MTPTLKSRLFFTLLMTLLTALVGLTFTSVVQQTRFGLEFRGGYEMYYLVAPLARQQPLTQQDLQGTVDILRQRADSMGLSEPEIKIEGQNHIRLKLPGLTSAEASRSSLANPQGLPTRLTEKYSQTVGSVLGPTAFQDTAIAGLIGVGAIFLLLIGLYRGLGLIASLATITYLWGLLILFNSAHATFSLPAVVALVLGIGVAADASIICFERIRDELKHNHPLKDAVMRGFDHSLLTIRDANLVTGVAMIVLFAAGVGPIQGFSLTMLASIVVGITTHFLLVRQLALWLADSGWLSAEQLIGKPKKTSEKAGPFRFSRIGGVAILVALLTIISGTLYYRGHGLNLEIDVTAGTALDIDLPHPIGPQHAMQIISKAGIVPASLAVGGVQHTHIAVRFDNVLQPEQLKAVINVFQTRYPKAVFEESIIDPAVARDFTHHAVLAILIALASITAFISARFTWRIAVATLVPIILEILVVSAVFALGKFEVDVTYIAAILTVIGYSLNDKIVMFSRISDNLRLAGPDTLEPLALQINRSVEQTFRRSTVTLLTVVMAAASLYFFACAPLEMFSIALLIGLICATCSSLFISSYVWLALQPQTLGTPAGVSRTQSIALLSATLALGVIGAIGWAVIPPENPSVVSPDNGTRLGDLSAFTKITRDALTLVQQGDMKGAKARMEVLDHEWDQAEEDLRRLNTADWTRVDKAIDRALLQVRSDSPVAQDCIVALQGLLAQIASTQPPVAQTNGHPHQRMQIKNNDAHR